MIQQWHYDCRKVNGRFKWNVRNRLREYYSSCSYNVTTDTYPGRTFYFQRIQPWSDQYENH